MTVWTHNYNGYAKGCRCEICTAAKAAYMRDRRSAGYPRDGFRNFRHGTRAGYEEHRCRCTACYVAHWDSFRAVPEAAS